MTSTIFTVYTTTKTETLYEISSPSTVPAPQPTATRHSKAGMVVYAKGSLADKTALVRAAAEAHGFKVEVKTAGRGDVQLVATGDAQQITHKWSATGQGRGGTVTRGGKTRKIRNVSDFLGLVGAK